MTSTAANNVAAIAAAISGVEEPGAVGSPQSNRRSFTLKSGAGRGADAVSLGRLGGVLAETNPAENIHGHDGHPGRNGESNFAMEGSAVVDGPATLESEGGIMKTRARRASEGAHLSRSDGKRSSGELRCEKCGKGYKHSSCLAKHLLVILAIYAHSYTLVTSSLIPERLLLSIYLCRGLFSRMDPTGSTVDISIGGNTPRSGI